MASELDNERDKGSFFENIKKNAVGYAIVAAVAVGATLLLTDKQEPDLGSYPPNDDPVKPFEFEEIIDVAGSYNYRAALIQKHVRERTQDSTFTSARAVTFDYQDLKNYMAFIEKNADDAKIRISGLRFYFGKYDNNPVPRKAHRQMIFYNPTVKSADGKNRDVAYAIQRIGDKTGIVPLEKVIDSILNQEKGKGSVRQESQVNEASVLSFFTNNAAFNGAETQAGNHGQLNPPPPDAQLVPNEQ